MLRRRIEKLEAHLPMSPDRLLERLYRQTLQQLSGSDRELVNQMLGGSTRRKNWPAEYREAEQLFLDNFSMLLREISDAELGAVITALERPLGPSLSGIKAIV